MPETRMSHRLATLHGVQGVCIDDTAVLHTPAMKREVAEGFSAQAKCSKVPARLARIDQTCASAVPLIDRNPGWATRERRRAASTHDVWQAILPMPHNTPLAICDQRRPDEAGLTTGVAATTLGAISMTQDVVIVDAVRSPLGKRNGGLSRVHPADLLGTVLAACVERAGIDSSDVEQLVGGCVEQVGEQAGNVTRSAWLDAGLAERTAAISLDSACGSSQQAIGLAASLVRSGAVDVAMACGLASMSRLPIATSFTAAFEPPPTERTLVSDHGPRYGALFEEYGFGQFGCAEVLAERYGVTRDDADEFGLRSQQRAIAAWDAGRFDAEVVPIRPFDADEPIRRDEGLRDSTLAKLATLKPVANANGVHTAASSSQISDGAAAVLLMSAQRAGELGLRPRARIVDHCHVGVDPVVMLEGPVAATERLLSRNKLTVGDIDLYEVNEAFDSVPLMWQRRFDADGDRLNPNGGAIALGHPIGATGARLITTALHELERDDGSLALVTMCAGGGLGTGTLIERL